MVNELIQPKGSVSKETNIQSIARITGVKISEVKYLEDDLDVTGLKYLYDSSTETVWKLNGDETGTVDSWIVQDDVLQLLTSTTTYQLNKFDIEHISVYAKYSVLSQPTGSTLINTSINQTVENIISNPSIVNGRANIRNPVWGAPTTDAELDSAASANTAAINKMLASGAKYIELDDKARRINGTLIYNNSVTIVGAGRGITSLVWIGGDFPVIARENFGDVDSAGASNVRLMDLKIIDKASTRTNFYTIDLYNGNSNGCERCWIDCPGNFNTDGSRIITSDKFGVALGKAKNSRISSPTFVTHFRDSRITNGTLLINSTDWYVTGCELWGSFRNRALEISGGGTIDGGTQIVPGNECGIYLYSDVGYDIDTLKVIGVYFDGSTDTTLYTGWGIKSAPGIGLISAEILGCDFWHMNQGGINLQKLYSSTINSNFRNCDSDDTGDADIVILDVYGSNIYNRHFRSTAPKKVISGVEQPRTNLGKPFDLTCKTGYPISSIGGEAGFSTSYTRCTVVNPTVAKLIGGSYLTTFVYNALPSAPNWYGETVFYNGRLYYSDGASWYDTTNNYQALQTSTDLLDLKISGTYYTSDLTIHTNGPVSVTGPANIEVGYVSAGYIVLTITVLKQSGGIYTRIQSGGTWGSWVKVA